jgi:CHASE3 domain sensor protein
MKLLQKNTFIFLFAFLGTGLIVAAFFSYTRLKQFETAKDAVVHTSIVKNNLTEILSMLKDAEAGQRGYILTGDTIYLEPYKGAEKQINLLLVELNTLLADDASDQREIKIFAKLIEARISILRTNLKRLELPPNNSFNESLILKGKNKMDEVKKQASTMLQKEDKELLQRIDLKHHSDSDTPIILLILSFLTIFFFSVLFSLSKGK